MDASSLCQDCGLAFAEKWMLKEHKRVAHDERVVKCDFCNVEIVGLMKLKAHKQKHKQKECKKCSLLVFANSWSSHQSKCSQEKFKCKQCSFETSQKSNLKAHIKSIHEATKKDNIKKEHTCIHCKKTSTSSSPASSPRKSYPANLKKSFVNRFLFDNLME